MTFSTSGFFISSQSVQPCLLLMDPSGPITLITGRLCRRPISQSLGSCAGVTFKNPVENRAFSSSLLASGSTTCSSATIGISRPTIGSRTILPTSDFARGSLGFIATAVSPSIVSGRVVATVTYSMVCPPTVTDCSSGYRMYQKCPCTVSCSTSSSASTVCVAGSQFTSRLPR